LKLKLQATDIFYRNLQSKAPIILNRGGARSGKSHALHQVLLTRFLSEENKKFLVVRKSLPSLRISALMDWERLIDRVGVRKKFREERLMLNFHYKSNLLHFGSVDDPEKIKSSEWNYVWMEEMTDFDLADFQQLRLRLSAPTKTMNQLFGSFNPISEKHWIKTEVLNKMSGVDEIVSTYKDNPFLSDDYVKTLEELKDQDVNLYSVYALGQWGSLEGSIYNKWEIVDSFPFSVDEEIYGLDFGFNNPTALIRVGIKDGNLWEEELLYQSGLTNSDLIDKLQELIKSKSSIIYADCAEPQRIEEIARAGFNIHSADKSVKDGIDFVKRFAPKITKWSSNLLKEKQGYIWKKDRQGNSLDVPISFADHLMDAERYAIYTHLKDSKMDMNIKQSSFINDYESGFIFNTRESYLETLEW